MAPESKPRKKTKVAETADASQASGVSERLLLSAALDAFVEKGFHGTSMREIAARAESSVSHIYYYFPSKQHILQLIMSNITKELIDRLQAAAAAVGDEDPAGQLAAIVRTHVLLHTERQAESFIGNTELRSLKPKDRQEVIALRDRVLGIFKQVIGRGLAKGTFSCPEQKEVTLAIVTMCTGVSGWYRDDGPAAAPLLADRFAAIALRMVGCR